MNTDQPTDSRQNPKPLAAPLTSAQSASSADITQAPFFHDPAFQQFWKRFCSFRSVIEDLLQLIDAGRYKIEDLPTLRLVVEDAFTLYDIVEGKTRMSVLLALMERNVKPEVFASLLVDLHNFLEPRLPQLVRALPLPTETVQ